MSGKTVAQLLTLPFCLLGLGMVETATAQSCTNSACLQSAIDAANADSHPQSMHSITLAAGSYSLAAGVQVRSTVQINGNGSIITLIQNDAIFISSSGRLTLNEVTLNNPTGGCIVNSGTVTLNSSTLRSCINGTLAFSFGGILNFFGGTVTLNSSWITGNSSAGAGGGILNQGTVTLNSSIISNNTSQDGGGIFNDGGGTVTLNSSTISGNRVTSQGGGIRNFGEVTLNKSSIYGNSAPVAGGGGGIYNVGILTLDKFSSVTLNTVENIAP